MKEKAPAVQWYPKQALGDDKILAMDWDAKGMHYTLCWISWQQEPPGTIPDDATIIRRWLGSPSDDIWRRVSPQVLAAWPIADVKTHPVNQGYWGRRVNSGMARAAEKQRIFSESRSKSSKSRWDTHAVRKPCESTEGEEETVFVLPDFIPEKPWNEYLEMRVRQKKPMTDHAKRLAVKELLRLNVIGHRPEAVLNQSIMNGWQGLFELKGNNLNGSGTSKAAEKLNRNREAIVSGLTGQGSWSDAGHSQPNVQRSGTNAGSGVVLEGSPQRTKSATNT